RLTGGRERVVVPDEANPGGAELEDLIRGEDGSVEGVGMEHVRAHLCGGEHVHVADQYLLAVGHLPITRQHEIVPNRIYQRRDGLTLRECGDGASLKTVAAVHHERMLWILPTQSVDQRAERGKTAAALEGRPLVLVEELVVDVELRVKIGGVQNG